MNFTLRKVGCPRVSDEFAMTEEKYSPDPYPSTLSFLIALSSFRYTYTFKFVEVIYFFSLCFFSHPMLFASNFPQNYRNYDIFDFFEFLHKNSSDPWDIKNRKKNIEESSTRKALLTVYGVGSEKIVLWFQREKFVVSRFVWNLCNCWAGSLKIVAYERRCWKMNLRGNLVTR